MNNLMQQSLAAGCGQPLSREQNDALYARVAAKDAQARNDMIEGNMALVIVKVEAFLRQFPHMAYIRDDLIAEGLWALTMAVDQMAETGPITDPNPTGYIGRGIELAVSNLTDEESTIVVPRRRQTEAREAGTPIRVPRPVGEKASTVVFAQLQDKDRTAVIDLWDTLLACCSDEMDRRIIQMRADGYTDREIATELDTWPSIVCARGLAIHERYLERCKDD